MREVTAYASEDGKVYATEREAAEADARLKLRQLDNFREETIVMLIKNAPAIVKALSGLAEVAQ